MRNINSILAILFSSALFFSATAQGGVGDPAPGFALSDAEGNEYSLSDYAGKIVVLEFFGHT